MKVFDSPSKLAVMLSLNPEPSYNVAVGLKTIEIRKTKPLLKPPFKVYVYSTIASHRTDFALAFYEGKYQKTFRCYYDYIETELNGTILSGKVIGEFICTQIDTLEIRHFTVFGHENVYTPITPNPDYSWLQNACLGYSEVASYGKGSPLYAWHISDLVVYDKPKHIFNYLKPCIDKYGYCQGCKHGHIIYPSWVETREDLELCVFDEECTNYLTKAPQSWCYVQEV